MTKEIRCSIEENFQLRPVSGESLEEGSDPSSRVLHMIRRGRDEKMFVSRLFIREDVQDRAITPNSKV